MYWRTALAINFAPVADAHNQYANQFVFDFGDDSVVADPVLPELAELLALEGFANAARVLKQSDALEDEAVDAAHNLRIKALQFARGPRVQINRPFQSAS